MSIVNMRVGGKVKKLQLTESFPLNLQEKTATENGEVVADEGYDGLGKVAVNVPIPEGYIKPTGTKTITENGTHDVSGYASAEVNVPTSGGGGTGECSGTHIIEVTELPTENIDTNAMYLCGGKYYKYSGETALTDLVICSGSDLISYKELVETYMGRILVVNVIPTRTSEGILEDTDAVAYMYYIQDENVCDYYSGGQWSGDNFPVSGVVSDISEVPVTSGETCYLIGYVGDFQEYLNPSGSMEITKNDTYDVSDKERVSVKISASYVVETVADLPEVVYDGDLAIVLY